MIARLVLGLLLTVVALRWPVGGRAVRWDHISVTKAKLAEPPSPAATEPDPPTVAEAAHLLGEASAADPDWGLLLWLRMVTGSRRERSARSAGVTSTSMALC